MICQAKPTKLVTCSMAKKEKPKTVCLKHGIQYNTASVVEENVEKLTMKTDEAVIWTQTYPEWRDRACGVTTVNATLKAKSSLPVGTEAGHTKQTCVDRLQRHLHCAETGNVQH